MICSSNCVHAIFFKFTTTLFHDSILTTLFCWASSCVQVLAEDGEVHVSLCNGQGGTPADHPKREWHNSWQVAAMAAEAHLILTDVHPFESEKYQSYKCTGYR